MTADRPPLQTTVAPRRGKHKSRVAAPSKSEQLADIKMKKEKLKRKTIDELVNGEGVQDNTLDDILR